ncbi:MAG: hypothetical protein RLZZ455_1218 [Candidatus Parcubacteria bacterium]|jgi:hypothetical protein
MIAIDRREGGDHGEPNSGVAIQRYLNEIEPLLEGSSRYPLRNPRTVIRVGIDDVSPDGSFRILDASGFDGYTKRSFELPSGVYTLSEEFSTEWYLVEKKTHELFHTLSGSDVEVDSALPDREESGTIEASYWSRWKEGTRSGQVYRQDIYPEVANHVLPEIVAARGRHRAVDLFGGDGEFVRLLQHSARVLGSTASLDWSLVDRDSASLSRARLHTNSPLARSREQQDGLKLTVHDPLDLTDVKKRQRLFREIGPQDLVTVIGGLNSSVITSVDAYQIAHDIREQLLVPGGTCVITGYTHSLLNRAMFIEMGFDVLQMSVPENIFANKLPRQLYVLRNPVHESAGE